MHDLAAVLAGAWADVDDPVGGADRVLVVLDDDEGVAEVLELDERLDEPTVVALVQADARLVEHVEHARSALSRSGWRDGCAALLHRDSVPAARMRLR